ncbi:MAG: hypothetical protein LUH14_06330 [Clostridiaceae bacterium]|nr:hypothetical protein [Clostridiaceae bacterium]
MRKRVWIESLAGCFLLFMLLGITRELIGTEQEGMETGGYKLQYEKREKDTLWIYPGESGEEFSPLSYETSGEENVLALCFSNLLIKDTSGSRANQAVGEEWEAGDDTLAHISVSYDEEKKISTIAIEVNPEAKTASGSSITADDLLFNYYLRCDPAAPGEEPFSGVTIIGQEEYRYGSSNLKQRKKELKAYKNHPTKKLKKRWQQEIVEKELEEEWEWVQSLYQDDTYQFITEEYEEPKELFAYYYAYQTKYSAKGKSASEVFSDIVSQYQWRYDELEKVTHESYSRRAEGIALSEFLKKDGTDQVKTIRGIKKTGERTVEIRAEGKEDINALCDLWVLPLEQYGQKSSFDGKSSFGFQKGTADKLWTVSFEKFNGSGAYYAASIDEESILLEANPYYFTESAKIKEIKILREGYQSSRGIVKALLAQEVDIVVTKDAKEIDTLLSDKATRASYAIHKVTYDTRKEENCFLYRTSYLNITTVPNELSQYNSIFQNMAHIAVNS